MDRQTQEQLTADHVAGMHADGIQDDCPVCYWSGLMQVDDDTTVRRAQEMVDNIGIVWR